MIYNDILPKEQITGSASIHPLLLKCVPSNNKITGQRKLLKDSTTQE